MTRAGPATTDQSDTPAGTGETGPAGEGADLPPGVTVVPETFHLVDYDAPTIAGIVASLARRIRLPTGLPVRVEVDETTPLGRSRLTSADPAVLSVESGALEDPHRPRQLSERAAATVLGRLLLQLQDRRDPAFGAPPEGTKLSAAESTTWDVYAMGRLARLGQAVRRPRWQYHFRVRHGFSDATDAVFDQIWDAHGLTWADLMRLSETATVKPPGG